MTGAHYFSMNFRCQRQAINRAGTEIIAPLIVILLLMFAIIVLMGIKLYKSTSKTAQNNAAATKDQTNSEAHRLNSNSNSNPNE